jgi:hypothetical protein
VGADVLLKVTDQLVSMLDILDYEENAHREGEESNKTDADFKAKALVKLCLSHRPFICIQVPPIQAGAKFCS